MFIPFLVDGIATKYAWQRSSRDQPELCSNLGENVTHTNCRKCFEGKGEMVQIVDPITGAVSAMDIDTPELPGGIDPTSFLFTVISISVLFQAIAFISLGTLGDYGDYRKRGLVAASTAGGVVTCMYVIVPADASLYWLGGVLMIVANVCLGVSVVFYNSYLPLMVDDSEEVRNAMAGGKEKGVESERDIIDAQEAVSSEYSSKGQMWGYVGGTTCLVLSVIALLVLVALGAEWFWALGVTSALSGAWWLGFSYFAFRRLPHRPGPPFPAAMNVYTEGWRKTYRLLALLWRTEVNTFYFLILFFIFSGRIQHDFDDCGYVCVPRALHGSHAAGAHRDHRAAHGGVRRVRVVKVPKAVRVEQQERFGAEPDAAGVDSAVGLRGFFHRRLRAADAGGDVRARGVVRPVSGFRAGVRPRAVFRADPRGSRG